ncbi:MAG: hypothetical protein DHS80DRAFT_33459 [Piptocephalis tieghemiana]|nr:MAG: hypothetical protein DHS80DRAFT_33459 [Piptocephalis tieghemiana]
MLLPTLIRTGGRVSWSPLTRSSGRSLGTFSPLRINTSSSYSSSYSTYSSASPQRWSRFLVPGLVAGNVAVFLTYSYGVSRLTNQRDGTIVRWFDRNGVLSSANFREGRWWTLLTHGFTHHNIIHLASNMIVLYSLGRPLALAIGARNFLATYLSSMVVGGMASLASRRYWYDPKSLRHQSASIGASGGVLGIATAYTFFVPRSTFLLMMVIPMPAWACLGLFVGYDTFSFLRRDEGFLDHACHLGGALTGAAAYTFLTRARRGGGGGSGANKAGGYLRSAYTRPPPPSSRDGKSREEGSIERIAVRDTTVLMHRVKCGTSRGKEQQ